MPSEPLCNDTCQYANDGVCDDGSLNSFSAFDDLGTDCSDCSTTTIDPQPCVASDECGDGFICQGGICVEEVLGCGDGVDMSYFSTMVSGDGSNYYLSSGSYSWEDANALANELGGHLVSINSLDENAVVESLAPGSNLWIGLHQNMNSSDYSEPNGGWEWVTGECLDYLNWAGVEPNDDNGEEYGHMNIFGTWSDWNGESYAVLPFVMEINCDPISVCPLPGCIDTSACNFSSDATEDDGSCTYPEVNFDCDGNCIAEVDCEGTCGGEVVVDACGECNGDGSSCSVDVTFSVDMSIEGVVGDIKVRTSTENGSYSPSDWFVMDDSDGDMIYTYTMTLITGVEYGYNFNDSNGSGYESGSNLEGVCAGGSYGNDRIVTPGAENMVLDTVCWESCEACPAIVEGCMDSTATNYNADATVDDGTCEYPVLEAANLFFSEYAEGSSNNKYLEIYNASDATVDLSGYAFPSVSNAPSTVGEYEYWNAFPEGATVDAGGVYIIAHALLTQLF